VDLTVRESATKSDTFSLFRKSFAAGTVSLGAQSNSVAPTYTIIVK
jgi:hypothetical protein